MTRQRRHLLWCGVLMLAAGRASAQRADSTAAARPDSGARSLACPAYGTTLRLWAGGPDSAVSPAPPRATRTRAPLDTVITLDIADRTWTRDSLTAGVAIGAGGTAGARRSPWHACAGASVMLGRVTATLHNVQAQIRFRGDPSALQSIGTSSGSTPPAVPPRR